MEYQLGEFIYQTITKFFVGIIGSISRVWLFRYHFSQVRSCEGRFSHCSSNWFVDDREVILIGDVIHTETTIKAALKALQDWWLAKELFFFWWQIGIQLNPNQPDFYVQVVPTSKNEIIDLRFTEVYEVEGVFFM